jgi:hypothetical protein
MAVYYFIKVSMILNKLQVLRKLITLDNLPLVLLTILLVLVPIAFSPSPFLSFVYLKALVISLGVLFAFILTILAIIKRGTVFFPRNVLAATSVGLVVVILISSLVSTSRIGSLVGYGFEYSRFWPRTENGSER